MKIDLQKEKKKKIEKYLVKKNWTFNEYFIFIKTIQLISCHVLLFRIKTLKYKYLTLKGSKKNLESLPLKSEYFSFYLHRLIFQMASGSNPNVINIDLIGLSNKEFLVNIFSMGFKN